MFFELYLKRLRCLTRQKNYIFVTLLLPLLLGALLHLAIPGGDGEKTADPVSVAVVGEEGENGLSGYLERVGTEKGEPIFLVTECGEEEARQLMREGRIKGYAVNGGEKLYIRNEGSAELLFQLYVDGFRQGVPIPAGETEESGDYVRTETAAGDSRLICFYALLALAGLLGAVWGVHEADILEAGRSALGPRLLLSGIPKWKLAASGFLAAVTVQFGELLFLLACLKWALKIEIGDHWAETAFLLLAGTAFSTALGFLAAVLLKGRKALLQGSLASAAVVCAVLAGLFSPQMKYGMELRLPGLVWANPAALITDALFSLSYYESPERCYLRAAVLGLLAAGFIALCLIRLRREQYADR